MHTHTHTQHAAHLIHILSKFFHMQRLGVNIEGVVKGLDLLQNQGAALKSFVAHSKIFPCR
jgi:hypothetical protein